jgi:hypothetical protein
MNSTTFETLSRKDKEALYIEKMTELQRLWGNPIDSNWDFSDWPDDRLDKALRNTIGQIRFEKNWSGMTTTVTTFLSIFVILGIIGLLLFGIKQLF